MKFANTELTEDSIEKTRQWFIDNAQACIEEARSGKVKVNDINSYVLWREEQIKNAIEKRIDHTFAFLQRAYFIQTGESIALLPL